MDPITILSFISLAIKAAPEAEQVFTDGKNLVQSLFDGGIITKAQQQAYMDWADAHQAATLAGQEPPEFVVDSAPLQQQTQNADGTAPLPKVIASDATAQTGPAPAPASPAATLAAPAPFYAGGVADHLASLATS